MKKTILVSAGHGGADPGAVSRDGKYREASLALALRDKVAAELRSRGFTVYADGVDGVNRPLQEAIKRPGQVRVEFHWNAGPLAATGVEALSKPPLKRLAQAVAGAVAGATKLPLRGERGWKSDSSGQHHRLAFCEAGGVILEVGFISNPSDLAAYFDNQGAVVGALADALAAEAGR